MTVKELIKALTDLGEMTQDFSVAFENQEWGLQVVCDLRITTLHEIKQTDKVVTDDYVTARRSMGATIDIIKSEVVVEMVFDGPVELN